MIKYDLTTESGLDKAIKLIKTMAKCNPVYYLYDRLFNLLEGLLNGNNPDNQLKAASEIIKAAAASGAEEIKITLDNTKEFKLKIPLEDVKIDTRLGSDGKLHLHVKFPKK